MNGPDPLAVALASVSVAPTVSGLCCSPAGMRCPADEVGSSCGTAHDPRMTNQQRVPHEASGRNIAAAGPAIPVRLAEPDEWVSLNNPDDPEDLPIYEGPAGAAGQMLIPGDYTGHGADTNPVSVTITD